MNADKEGLRVREADDMTQHSEDKAAMLHQDAAQPVKVSLKVTPVRKG